jgi:hypothetical protein
MAAGRYRGARAIVNRAAGVRTCRVKFGCAAADARRVTDPPAPEPAPRSRPRAPLRIEAVGDAARGPRFLGYLANMSETGAFVQSSNPRPPGTRLKMKLHLLGRRKRPFYVQAEVRWTRGYGGLTGPTPGMGIEFVDLERRQQRELSRVIDAHCVALAGVASR